MNKAVNFFALGTLMFFGASCLNNSLEEPFNCDFSDLSASTTVVDAQCGTTSGSITIEASGGLAPLTYVVDGIGVQTTPNFENLPAGTYIVIITDTNNCSVETTAIINNIGGFTVSSTTIPSDCTTPTGKIILEATGGNAPYSYQLGTGTSQSSPEFNVGAGEYTVTTTDNSGCSFVSSIRVLTTTSYQANVSPTIMNSCAVSNCHNGSNPARANFTNFSVVQANAAGIRSRTQNGSMPPNGTLSQDQKDLIACWVDDGALAN